MLISRSRKVPASNGFVCRACRHTPIPVFSEKSILAPKKVSNEKVFVVAKICFVRLVNSLIEWAKVEQEMEQKDLIFDIFSGDFFQGSKSALKFWRDKGSLWSHAYFHWTANWY